MAATGTGQNASISGIEKRLDQVETAVKQQAAKQCDLLEKIEQRLYYQYYFFRFWYYGSMVALALFLLACIFLFAVGGLVHYDVQRVGQ